MNNQITFFLSGDKVFPMEKLPLKKHLKLIRPSKGQIHGETRCRLTPAGKNPSDGTKRCYWF